MKCEQQNIVQSCYTTGSITLWDFIVIHFTFYFLFGLKYAINILLIKLFPILAGGSPYQGISPHDIMSHVGSGGRLGKPDRCSPYL